MLHHIRMGKLAGWRPRGHHERVRESSCFFIKTTNECFDASNVEMVSTTRYGLSRTASWVKTHRLKYKSNRAQLSDRSGRPEMPRVCVCFYVQKSRRHRHHDGKTTPKRPLAFPFLPSSRGIRNEGWKTCSSGLRLPRLGLGREKCVDFLGWTSLLSHVVAPVSYTHLTLPTNREV